MAFYITKHLPPLGTPSPGHVQPGCSENFKQTVITPLDSGFPSTTTTRFEHSAATTSPQQQQQQQQPPTNTHPIANPETLTHLLHTFHTHQHDNSTGTTNKNGSGGTHPAFDLAETRSCYTIYGDLPGLRQADVTVETDDVLCTVTISGTLAQGKPGEVKVREGVELVEGDKPGDEAGVHWHVRERGTGKFRRQFHLPVGTVEMAMARARMEEGVLIVVVPKTMGEMAREGVVRGRRVVWEMQGGVISEGA